MTHQVFKPYKAFKRGSKNADLLHKLNLSPWKPWFVLKESLNFVWLKLYEPSWVVFDNKHCTPGIRGGMLRGPTHSRIKPRMKSLAPTVRTWTLKLKLHLHFMFLKHQIVQVTTYVHTFKDHMNNHLHQTGGKLLLLLAKRSEICNLSEFASRVTLTRIAKRS